MARPKSKGAKITTSSQSTDDVDYSIFRQPIEVQVSLGKLREQWQLKGMNHMIWVSLNNALVTAHTRGIPYSRSQLKKIYTLMQNFASLSKEEENELMETITANVLNRKKPRKTPEHFLRTLSFFIIASVLAILLSNYWNIHSAFLITGLMLVIWFVLRLVIRRKTCPNCGESANFKTEYTEEAGRDISSKEEERKIATLRFKDGDKIDINALVDVKYLNIDYNDANTCYNCGYMNFGFRRESYEIKE